MPGRLTLLDERLQALLAFGARSPLGDSAFGGETVEALACDEVAARRTGTDLAQREGRDDGRDDPELDLGERELGLGLRDRDVRARDEPAAAAEGVTLDARDHRCGAGIDGLEHLPQPPGVGDVLLVAQL